jgi:hypothetical protein
MGCCICIELWYHPIYQTVAIRTCSAESDTGLCWTNEKGEYKNRFRVEAFMSALYEKMNWIEDLTFQFRGVYRERGNARILFFSLDEPRIYLNDGKRREKAEADAENGTASVQYIKYKKDDREDLTAIPDIAYPIEWQKSIGLSCSMRARRDRLTEIITESDVLVNGTCALNPIIGELPTKAQAIAELEALLIEM